ITAIVKSESSDPTKILFLKIKAFISVNKDVEHYIDPFEIVTNLEFDNMLAIGMDVTITGQTIQIAKTVDGNIVLNFFVEKRISKKEPADFWIEVRYKIINTYLVNRTNAINQKICSTTALLVGTMNYLCSISNSNEGKHILALEEILLFSIYVNNKNTNNREINIPWLSQDRTILSQMGLTTLSSSSSILQTALNSNPIPSSTEQTPSSQETQDQNNQTNHEFN
ncbi:37815_t:CDS:2, partial [Gigaspora margarita]